MLKRLLIIFTLFVLATPASADLIYSNGGPAGVDGDEITGFVKANDFTFGSPQVLTDVRFWGFEPNANPNAYQGSVTWQIYNNTAGIPGAILFSATATPTISGCVSITLFNQQTAESCQYDFSVGSLNLAAGTYWLALHNGPLTTTTVLEFYWERTTSPNGTLLNRVDLVPFGDGFLLNSAENAFALFGPSAAVPEPSSMLLTGLGLITLRFLRRFRAQK